MAVIWLHYTNWESGGRIPVMIQWDWNVLLLKEAIFCQLSRIPDKLIYAGKELINDQILGDLAMEEFCTICCELATPCTVRNMDCKQDDDAGGSHCESQSLRQLPSLLADRRQGEWEQRTDIPASPGTGPLDTSAIHVEVEEYYVQMREQTEPLYLQLSPRDRDSGVFNFSFRRYLAETDSVASESSHEYETLDSFTLHSSHLKEPGTTRRFFSVYCRDICGDVTRGKLGVRCWSCKSVKFELSRDPCCWDDVTGSGITGLCHACRGEGERAEFYFKCANHQQESIAIPLRQVKMNERQLECIICGECPDRLMVFECVSGHVTCLPCFTEYVRVNLTSRQFRYDRTIGYSLGCPAGCLNSLISDQHHFRLLGEELYETLQRFATEEYVLAEGGVLCPAPGCGEGVIRTGRDRLVTCEACCHMFCRRCMLRAHFGACEATLPVRGGAPRVRMRGDIHRGSWRFGEKRRKGAESREGESEWARNSGLKSCPSCNSPVQREGGCAHMKCSVGVCRFEWCWICEKKWRLECREDHWFE